MTCTMCRIQFTARLPPRSSRWRRGGPSPSAEDRAKGGGSAPAGELSLAGEPAGVVDLDQQVHGVDDADAVDGGQGAAEPLEKGRDFPVGFLDAGGQGGDVGEVATSRSILV